MRVYYLFKINNYFSYMYKNKPYRMYKMLEEIYHARDYDMVLTYRMYEQIAKPFSKNSLNDYLYYKYKDNLSYMKSNNIHIYANSIEYTKLVIANSNIKIKTNINYSIFFEYLNTYDKNIFVCDFVNKDYFWLNNIVKKDRQKDIYLVK